MTPFTPQDDASLLVSLGPVETQLVADLATQVADLLDESVAVGDDNLFATIGIGGGESAPEDPAVARLLPDAYADDPDASRDFRRLTEHSLAARKVANARLVELSLRSPAGGPVRLDEAAQQAWLRTFTDIRLVIASRLGIEGDDDRGLHETDEQVMMREVYDWLGALQDALVRAVDR